MNARNKAIAIDFGTSNSSVAVLDEFGRPRAIENAEGEPLTPTLLFFDSDKWTIGKQARELAALDASRFLACVKRELSEVQQSGDDPAITIAGGSYPLSVVIGAFLGELVRQASNQLGEPIDTVVLTVPARFADPARRILLDAGAKAGLQVLGLINEPTAAALAYGLQKKTEATVLVYDFGGGTLDCTLVRYEHGKAEVLGSDGVPMLGGTDFDEQLNHLVYDLFKNKHGINLDPKADALAWLEIHDRTVRLKHALSTRGEVLGIFQARGKEVQLKLTRQQFETLTKDLLDKALALPEKLLASLHMTISDVTDVLLVGGSTRIPAIREGLKARFGKEPKGDIPPDLAVAYGAAVHAGILLAQQGATIVAPGGKTLPPPKVRFSDVTSFPLGCEVFDKSKEFGRCAVIIPANTPIPCAKKDSFFLVEEGQTAVAVRVLQGDDQEPASKCVQVYELALEDLPPAPVTTERIEVEHSFDANGVVKVVVRDTVSGKEAVGSFNYTAGLKGGSPKAA